MKIIRGKKKYFTIPIAALVGLLFLPLTILLAIALLVKNKVHNTKIRTVSYSIIGLIALPFVAAYAVAFTSPPSSPSPSPNVIATDTPEPLPTPESQSETLGTEDQVNVEEYKITRIIDGDTFEIEGGQRVRLIGIDTPELSGTVECFAREAYDKAVELLEGKNVRLEKDVSETDKYGRLLRYVYLGDIFINKQLVLEGYANASSYPPDIKHQEEFRTAEQEARNENRGLWAGCATPKPSVTPKATVKPAATNAPVQSGGSPSTGNQNPSGGGAYTCSCSKACTVISSCAEAQYQLNVCGCKQRDADNDGIACDGAPLNCQ